MTNKPKSFTVVQEIIFAFIAIIASVGYYMEFPDHNELIAFIPGGIALARLVVKAFVKEEREMDKKHGLHTMFMYRQKFNLMDYVIFIVVLFFATAPILGMQNIMGSILTLAVASLVFFTGIERRKTREEIEEDIKAVAKQ